MRVVRLIVALGFCKAHYETFPYFIHFNRLVCSPFMHVVIKFLVLESRLPMHISSLLWPYPVDTETGTAKTLKDSY